MTSPSSAPADTTPATGVEQSDPTQPQRAAIVYNPIKGSDEHWEQLRRDCAQRARQAGWDEPQWLETTPDDPGRGQALEAVEAGADIVFAAGGDGTVRNVGGALVGTDVPLGLIPSGTGNLLARNLGVPHIDSAAEAFGSVLKNGRDVRIDVGRVRAQIAHSANNNSTPNGPLPGGNSGQPGEAIDDIFLIMSGYGLDGDIMDTTSERLKAAIGWLAYPISGLKYLWQRPERMVATFNDEPPQTKKTTSLLVGNFGRLTGGVRLMPGAKGDDGEFDSVWLSADGPLEWASLTRTIMLGTRSTERVARRRMTKAHAKSLGAPRALELDGDVVGRASEIEVTIDPLALTVRIPENSTHPRRQKVTNAVASLRRRR